MRRFTTLSLVLAAGFAATTANAAVVWTGGNDGAVFDDSNYDFSGSALTAIDLTTTIDDDVSFTGATINASDFAGFSAYIMGDGSTMTLDGTSFTSNSSGGISGVAAGTTSTFDLNNGSFMSLQFMSLGATVNVDGTSSIQFRGGGDPINSQVDQVFLNLAPGAQLTLTSVAEFTEQGADIYVNGVSFADDASILTFNGNTGTAVLVPEPGSLALLGLGGLALIRRRRA